jgi:hypothetical protein
MGITGTWWCHNQAKATYAALLTERLADLLRAADGPVSALDPASATAPYRLIPRVAALCRAVLAA